MEEKKEAPKKGGLWKIILGVMLLLFMILGVLLYSFFSANMRKAKPSTKRSKTSTHYAPKKIKDRKKDHTFSKREKEHYEQLLKLARDYQKQGDDAGSLKEKENYYQLALIELKEIKKNRPSTIGEKRAIIAEITEEFYKNSKLRVKVGDTREAVEKALGKPQEERESIDYFPLGTVIDLYYYDDSVVISLNSDDLKVFSVNIKSTFTGSYYGIKVGDTFQKIKTMFEGKKTKPPGTNYQYVTSEEMLEFLFVNRDDKVDNFKQIDENVHNALKD